MKYFGTLPIKLKIIVLLLFVSFLALIIASTFFIYNDLKSFKKNLVHNLTALTGTVGANSRAALYFRDESTATQILSSLKEDSQIQYAALYDSNGDIFVNYKRNNFRTDQPQGKENLVHVFKEGVIELKRPIFLNEKKIGDIHVSADLKDYNAVIKKYFFIVGVILFSTFGVVIILSFVLQNYISNPIQTLAKTIKEISSKNDYSQRVEHQHRDEIGDLYFGFNQMISQIEKRDKELTLTNNDLRKEIEQRKRAENSLKFYSTELLRSNRELQDFATIASHDLQEPLRKIITFGDRVAEQVPAIDEKGKHYIMRLQNASQRMKNFINDLLEYSKIESQAKPFKKQDLNTILFEVLEILEIQICRTQAQISCDSLPTLEVDSFQIHQLFQNLIGNAIKFKKADDPPVIKISTRKIENGFWEIAVKDDGIGFDTNYLERIFKPFERLHGKNEYEGSGMGLTICKKIVTRHGGSITASSIPGEGSTFLISLPETQQREKTILTFPLENNLESI